MHASAPRPPRPKAKKRATNRYSKAVIRWLIFCPPAGLLMMWSDRCRWARGAKSLISMAMAALIVAIFLPFTLPPERVAGGIELVSTKAALEVQGPEQESEDIGQYEVYVPTYIKPPSVIVEPEPTPEPIYVYANTGGKNYHNKECKFVKSSSVRMSLGTALNAGFSRCKICNAPAEHLVA